MEYYEIKGTRTKGPNIKCQFSLNLLYLSIAFLYSVTKNGLPNNNRYHFQDNVPKVNRVWEAYAIYFRLLSLFKKIIRHKRLSCVSMSVCVSPEPLRMRLGMYTMAPKSISTAYFINPSLQSMCLHVYLFIVARQRLGKHVPASTNT
jgi:hypothetical protein